MKLWQELDASVIVGIDVGVAYLTNHRLIADQQVDAVNVLSGLCTIAFFSVIISIELFNSIFKASTDIHNFNLYTNLLFMLFYIIN